MRVIQIKDGKIYSREMTAFLRARVISELTALAEGYKGTGWKVTCPIKAYERTKDEFVFVVLENEGIMAVSSQVPWFAEEYVLCEEWLGAGVTVSDAADALHLICKTRGMSRFEVGTRATPGQKHEAAARLYQRQGLRLSTISLEGVVDHEQETVTQGDGSSQATGSIGSVGREGSQAGTGSQASGPSTGSPSSSAGQPSGGSKRSGAEADPVGLRATAGTTRSERESAGRHRVTND